VKKNLMPHTQRIVEYEIARARNERNDGPCRVPEAGSVEKNDIEKLRDNFAGILVGRVTVGE
jgi:hypothetical protein